MKIKVITLYQPWATWIIWGWKTIETRLHDRFNCLVDLRIGIHASKKYDVTAYTAAKEYLTSEQRKFHQDILWENRQEEMYPTGVLLGTVRVIRAGALNYSHSQNALIDCENTERYGLFLTGRNQFNPPIPMSGHRGIWECEI